jgi:hypothetical protein
MTRQALSRVGQPSRRRQLLTDLGYLVAAALIVASIIVATFALGAQVAP